VIYQVLYKYYIYNRYVSLDPLNDYSRCFYIRNWFIVTENIFGSFTLWWLLQMGSWLPLQLHFNSSRFLLLQHSLIFRSLLCIGTWNVVFEQGVTHMHKAAVC
jgi:hypothetical protein